jgi:hypothetical protein
LITLNRPLITKASQGTTPSFAHRCAEALDICETSVKTIIGIIRRYGAQHTLQKAPLVFVHSAIIAADAALARLSIPNPSLQPLPLLLKSTVLPTLNTILGELSHAWTIAGDATARLGHLIDQIQTENSPPIADERATSSSSSPTCSIGLSPNTLDHQVVDTEGLAILGVKTQTCLSKMPQMVDACFPFLQSTAQLGDLVDYNFGFDLASECFLNDENTICI